MIKLNRTTEYGLIALRHIGRKRESDAHAVTSAREIADTYGLPFEITAKTLQRLKERGLILSEQGARGGYLLGRSLDQVTLADFLQMMEGNQALVPCASHADAAESIEPIKEPGCEYSGKCEMRGVMSDLNGRVWGFLASIRLSELAGMSGAVFSDSDRDDAKTVPFAAVTRAGSVPFAYSQKISSLTPNLGDEP